MPNIVKLDAGMQEQICKTLRAGNYIEVAAALAGISKVTLYKWLKRGKRAGRGIYYDFVQAVEAAQAESESRDVLRITIASAKSWQAAAWRLERKFPERWSPRHRMEHSGVNGGPIETRAMPTIFIPPEDPLEGDDAVPVPTTKGRRKIKVKAKPSADGNGDG